MQYGSYNAQNQYSNDYRQGHFGGYFKEVMAEHLYSDEGKQCGQTYFQVVELAEEMGNQEEQ